MNKSIIRVGIYSFSKACSYLLISKIIDIPHRNIAAAENRVKKRKNTCINR
jgi:hypothetical protein